MANIQKFSDMRAIGHLCTHYERGVEKGHYSNTDIDENRTAGNYNLAQDRGKQTDYIKETIREVMGDRTLRKDAVRMCCCVVDAPKNLPIEKEEIFFIAVYDFLVGRYGSKAGMGDDIVVSAYVHTDETTRHLHFAFMPIEERDGIRTFCAKNVVGRQDLKTLHQDLGAYLEKLGICKKKDILNGKTQCDSSGRALSVKELKKRSRERDRDREKVSRWDGTDRTTDITVEKGSRW